MMLLVADLDLLSRVFPISTLQELLTTKVPTLIHRLQLTNTQLQQAEVKFYLTSAEAGALTDKTPHMALFTIASGSSHDALNGISIEPNMKLWVSASIPVDLFINTSALPVRKMVR